MQSTDVGAACPSSSTTAASDDWVVVGEQRLPEAVGGTSAQDTEPAAPASSEPAAELDLCFMCDCTGSMGAYIHAAQRNIDGIVRRISEGQQADVRFALISYRDHPPQDKSYVTRSFPFTSSVQEMSAYVGTMSAAGGGDGPEAVTAALSDALHQPWRPNATKVAVLIADAPPHGLEPSGDGFPNGDPEGRDPLDIARQMAAHGITCYSVGVEPVLGQYCFARDFMCTIAEITGGQAVALSSASLLAEVIVNGSAEEISLTKLQREVESEVRQVQKAAEAAGEVLRPEECCRRAWGGLQSRDVRSLRMSTDGGMLNLTPSVWHRPAGTPSQSLAGAKAELTAMAPPAPAAAPTAAFSAMPRPSSVAMPGGAAAPPMPTSAHPLLASMAVPDSSAPPCAWQRAPPRAQASTRNCLSEGSITMEQVSRIMTKSAGATV